MMTYCGQDITEVLQEMMKYTKTRSLYLKSNVERERDLLCVGTAPTSAFQTPRPNQIFKTNFFDAHEVFLF